MDRCSGLGSTRRLARSVALVALLGLCHALPLSGAIDGSVARAADPVAGETEKPHVDAAAVYYGHAANWKSPAEVDADAVYAEIPEYKKILADGLEPDSPKYQLLMNRASKRFVAAIRLAAREGKYDLVARSGAVKGVADVPDVTAAVIENL